jgi:hypothetical protein
MSQLRLAFAIFLFLPAIISCQRTSHTYTVYSFVLDGPNGRIETTIFGEVADKSMCEKAAEGAKLGVKKGDPQGNASGGNAICVTELPGELKAVALGGRLPGAYIVRTYSPPFLVYSVSRGFPLDIPDTICNSLVEKSRKNSKDIRAEITCLPPMEVDLKK